MKAEVHIGDWLKDEGPHAPKRVVEIEVDDETHSVFLDCLVKQLTAEDNRQPSQATIAVGDYLVLRPSPQPSSADTIKVPVEIEGEQFYWLHEATTRMTLFRQEDGEYFAYIDIEKEPKRSDDDGITVVGHMLIVYASFSPNRVRDGGIIKYPAEDLPMAVNDIEEKMAKWVVKRREGQAEYEGRAAMLATYLSERGSTERANG